MARRPPLIGVSTLRTLAAFSLLYLVPFGVTHGARKHKQSPVELSDSTKQIVEEKKPIKLEISCPKQNAVVIFSNPLHPDAEELSMWFWTRVSIMDARGRETIVEDLVTDPGAAVQLATVRDRWSPDGRYLLISRWSNAEDPKTSVLTPVFLDAIDASWATFKAGEVPADKAQVFGWKKGDPHTLLISDKGASLEAQPELQ